MNQAQLKLPLTDQDERYNSDLQARYEIKELRNPDQADDVIRLAVEFTQDVDLNDYIEPRVLRMHCEDLCTDMLREHLNCWIAYKGEAAIGFLVGVCFNTWYNYRIVAEQKLWFVTKKYRGTRAALMLINSYESWARLNRATQIYTGVANARYADKTGRMLERLGYRSVGSVHVKEI